MERPLILIVDDESKIRRLLAQNLELEGFDVQTASDGAQALEVYHKSVEKPDLILLDLMLPEIDGMTMLKRLRKSSDVPVIILSAKDERPTVIEGFREGADDFVSKPFYIEELMERIRAVLRRGKARSWSTLLKLRNLSAEGSDYCLVVQSINTLSIK
ncbi:MAG: response regulator transcription factor [Parasutterella sp.]